MVVRSNNSIRDFFLAVFSATGLIFLINQLFLGFFMVSKISNSAITLSISRTIGITQLILYLLFSTLVYKKIKLSEDYSKWFMIFAVLIFIGEILLNSLLYI